MVLLGNIPEDLLSLKIIMTQVKFTEYYYKKKNNNMNNQRNVVQIADTTISEKQK